MNEEIFRKRLISKGLKVTSRRVSVIEAIAELHHPTADEILKHIRKKYPSTATATVYKALNVLVDRKVIDRVNSHDDIVRYDDVLKSHHHLFSSGLNRITDYHDEELTKLLKKYFRKNRIPGFKIEDIRLQISGEFTGENV